MTNTTDTQTYTKRQLRDMPDADLDAVVRFMVFGQPEAKMRSFSSSWAGLGRLTEYLNQRGYSLHCNVFTPVHLVWLNNQPGILSSGERYRPAEVRVVDIYKRQGREPAEANLRVRADTLPRAVAIAAVLTCQREQATIQQRRVNSRKRRGAAEAESSADADPPAPPQRS